MKRKLLLVCVLLFFPPALYAVIVGSNESVSMQSHVAFPAADTDNVINGFAWMNEGFSLEDASTTCVFNSVYPVSGDINFNGGTLILNQNLILSDITSLNLGTIIGNGHKIEFSLTVTGFGDGLTIFQDVNMRINSDVAITGTVIFQGSCQLRAAFTTLSLVGPDAQVLIDANSLFEAGYINIEGLHGNNFACVDDTGIYLIDDVFLYQDGDFAWSKGSIIMNDIVDWHGSVDPFITFSFTYDSAKTMTFNAETTVRFLDNLVLDIAKADDNAPDLVFMTDGTSVFKLENATLQVNTHGLTLTNGGVGFAGNVTFDIASTSTAGALRFGDGIAAHDVNFRFTPASFLNFPNGLFILDVINFDSVQSKGGSSVFARAAQSILRIDHNLTISNLIFQNQGAQTVLGSGVTPLFENVTFEIPGGTFLMTGYFINDFTNLLAGNQIISVVSGIFPLVTLIAQTNNTINGSGIINGPIILQDSNAALTLGFIGKLDANITMNGGSLSLVSDLNFGHDALLSGSGNVHLNNNNMNFGDIDLTWTGQAYWDGSTGVINFAAGVALSNTWTFSGNCIIDGGGNELDLFNGEIVVERGSTLEFRNIIINNVSGANIRCLDNAASIVLNVVTWAQDTDYTCTVGSFQMDNSVIFKGSKRFVYQSDRPFTVDRDTLWTLDVGFTFSYDTSSPDLLQFFDSSSVLVLNSATLAATQQGLNLRQGQLHVQGNSLLSTTSAITVGDCVTGTNDCGVTVFSNAQLEIALGAFNYKNVSAASWNMQSTSILRTDGGAALNLYEVLNLGSGSAVFGNNATLGNQTNLIGSSSQEGVLNIVVLPPC